MSERFCITPPYVIGNVSRMWTLYLKQGITRKDVATVAQVSERAIRNYEDGKQYPSRSTYNKLAAFFGWEVWQ